MMRYETHCLFNLVLQAKEIFNEQQTALKTLGNFAECFSDHDLQLFEFCLFAFFLEALQSHTKTQYIFLRGFICCPYFFSINHSEGN